MKSLLVSLLIAASVAASPIKAQEFKPENPVLKVVCTAMTEDAKRPVLEIDGVNVSYLGDRVLQFTAMPYLDSVYVVPDGVLCAMSPTEGDNNNNDGQ